MAAVRAVGSATTNSDPHLSWLPAASTRVGSRAMVMVKPAEHGDGHDVPRITAGLPWCRDRNALGQPLMRSRGVVIWEGGLVEHACCVPFTEDDDVMRTRILASPEAA